MRNGFRRSWRAVFFLLLVPVFGVPSLAEETQARRVSLRVNPLGLMFGVWGAQLQMGVARSVTVGLVYNQFEHAATGGSLVAHEYGVTSSYYLTAPRFADGWLVQGSLRYLPTNNLRRDGSLRLFEHASSVTGTGGYEWDWPSGLNLYLGAGFALDTAHIDTRFQPLLAWQMGWAI